MLTDKALIFHNPNQVGGKSRKQATKSKYDELSLTEIHHEFIRRFGMGEVSKGSWYDLAQAMKDSPECPLTSAQENNLCGLASRIKDYVKRRKQAKDPNFVKWGKQPMTGDECKAVLDALMTIPSEREENPPLEMSFVKSSDFASVWQKIVVVKHNYDGNGSTFDHILLEYDDAKLRAEKATKMYQDGRAQLDMDFLWVFPLRMNGRSDILEISNIAIEPNRDRVRDAYNILRSISQYKVPDPDAHISEGVSRNFAPDWLYCLCTVTEIDEAGNVVEKEVPLHSVLGKECVEYKVTLPSISCIFSELKFMLREDAQYSIGAPMAMQMLSMSVDSIRNMLRSLISSRTLI